MKMHTIRITSCKSADRNQSLKRSVWPLSGGPDRVTTWKFQSRKLLAGLLDALSGVTRSCLVVMHGRTLLAWYDIHAKPDA
jgi:hypothetical protein